MTQQRIDILTALILSLGRDDPEVCRLLQLSVGRILRRQDLHQDLTRELIEKIEHIADWLLAAVRASAHWLTIVDPEGRPRKLMKLGSIDAAVAEADRQMVKMISRGEAAALTGKDEETLARLDQGDRLVRMTSPEALDRESARMGHCIGNGSYDDLIVDPNRLYLSLRDRLDRPRATVEIRDNDVIQCRGRRNGVVAPTDIDRIRSALVALGFSWPIDPDEIVLKRLNHERAILATLLGFATRKADG
jgi:hypothetical protein